MLWHSLEGRLNPYHCSQTAIEYKNTVIWVIVTSSLFTEEFVLHQDQPQINWLEYTPVISPILPSAPMYYNHSVCLFEVQPRFAGKEWQRSIGIINLCTTTWKSFLWYWCSVRENDSEKYCSLEPEKKQSQEQCSSTTERVNGWNSFVDNRRDRGRVLIDSALKKC